MALMVDLVWRNGVIVSTHDAISASDRGFTLGDGLFETMLWTGTTIRRFDRHMARLTDACTALHLPPPPPATTLLDAIEALLSATGLAGSTAAVRLSYSRGAGARGLAMPPQSQPATCLINASAFTPDPSPVHLHLASIRRAAGNPSARYKTLSYGDQVMAMAEATAAGASDALMLGQDGRVACASSATIIVVDQQGECLTPPVDDGALPGTTRAALLAAGLVQEAALTINDLSTAQGLATGNALHGVRPVAALSLGLQGLEPLSRYRTDLESVRQLGIAANDLG
jgi:branched-chain amino acid aminotransferase